MFLKIINKIKDIGLSSIIAILIILSGLIFGLMVFQTPKQQYAFPSAQGYGAFTSGGRGGVVYHVRTLEDKNELGSLRYAIEQKGPRTIVFDISGIIDLKSPLVIKNGDLTIAGQTAPGDGICIRNYPVSIEADNIIIRYIRFRLGDKSNGTALTAKNRHDIILDHCSFSWASIDNVALYNNRNLTMQWCIISEALNTGNANNGMGATLGGYSSTYHHNLFASNRTNNPNFYKASHANKLDLETVDFRNNVLYNWGSSSISGAESGSYNIVNNYFKFGPATQIASRSQIMEVTNVGRYGIAYVNGNYVYINPLQTNDNWMGVYPNMDYIRTSTNPILTRSEFYHEPVLTHSAERAFENVLAHAGASYKRDFVDNRIVKDVNTYMSGSTSNTGLITSPKDVGDYPKYNSDVPVVDSDSDGIPDDWEFNHNLNPYDTGDAKNLTESGYTYLEVYLNSLVGDITKQQNVKSLPTFDSIRLLVQKTANKIKKHETIEP